MPVYETQANPNSEEFAANREGHLASSSKSFAGWKKK